MGIEIYWRGLENVMLMKTQLSNWALDFNLEFAKNTVFPLFIKLSYLFVNTVKTKRLVHRSGFL